MFHAGPFRRHQVAYVTDDARWSFFWDGYYLTRGLNRLPGIRARVTRSPWRLHNRCVHFGDRYRFRDPRVEELLERNRVFLTWFHGHHDDPEFAEHFEHLVRVQEQVEAVLTTCVDSQHHLIAAGVDGSRLRVIPLGVDLQRMRPADPHRRVRLRKRLGIPRDAFCVGSFQKDGCGWGDGMTPKMIKGPDVLLDTVAQLHRRHPNVFVLLTGPARGYVQHGLHRLGIPFRHRLIKNYWKLGAFYQALDAYVITSRCEGGPKALVEAWACGVPVVSTRMGMPADLVEHGVNGLLANIDDSAQLATGLLTLAVDRQRAERIAAAGLAAVTQLHWDQIARRYAQQLYLPQPAESKGLAA